MDYFGFGAAKDFIVDVAPPFAKRGVVPMQTVLSRASKI